MLRDISLVIGCLSLVGAASRPGGTDPAEQFVWRGVWEWSMDHRTEAGLVEIAVACQSLGFNVLMMSPPEDLIGFMREQCHQRGIKLYRSTVFSGGDESWQQVITPAEQERAKQPFRETYQHGGEPYTADELYKRLLPCWNRPEVREYFRKKVTNFAGSPVGGLAFDGVGYTNYYRCYCPTCEARLAEFREQHPQLSEQEASAICAEQAMVDFINEMAETARAVRPDIELTIHVYPYFRPHPYHGNRLDVDYVGETVAWFFRPHWPLEKVGRLADEIVRTQAAHWPEHHAAPFIGFNSRPARDVRSPRRVQAEIDLVRASGVSAIQFAELGQIARRPTVARVVATALRGTMPPARAEE
jgi:hypothetical protein